MRDISAMLKAVYEAHSAIVVPGSGTFGMESVARQFATGKKVLVIRNGWFSYRWTQIFEMGAIPAATVVLKARPSAERPPGRLRAGADRRSGRRDPRAEAGRGVRAARGDRLRDDPARRLPARGGDAVHEVGGLFVLDCIASGAIWVDMEATGVDVLISAPQKGWSSSPCCALVMLGERARERDRRHHQHQLRLRPEQVAADHGGLREAAATCTTPPCPPTRCARLRDVMKETEAYGFDKVQRRAAGAGRQGARAAREPRLPQRRRRGLRGAGRGRELHRPTPTSSPARSSPRRACRPPPACRCSATSRPTSAPSASACSAWTSCTTSTARWAR